ncbi:MAG: hypothetical protein R3C52_13750 [Hyphomonadaceae bacterium]
MFRRRKRRFPFAAYAALIFNAALILTPFIAARAALTAYGEREPSFESVQASLRATQSAMDARFRKLAANGEGTPREVWAGYVRQALEADQEAEVRGLLLAAPAMLDGDDARALKERINVSEGSGDEAVIEAALAYLPEDVQAEYERRTASVLAMFRNAGDEAEAAAADASTGASTGAATGDAAGEAGTQDGAYYEEEPAEFSMLGDLRDLSLQAARWVRNDDIDMTAFVLSGLGLTRADKQAREGASIVLAALRSDSLTPEFRAYLQKRLDQAAPPQRLKAQLEAGFNNDLGYVLNGEDVVRKAFEDSIDPVALAGLTSDLHVIEELATYTSRDTSIHSAVAILSQVRSSADLSRARLIVQAGGDRAVPLALHDSSGRFLDTARTVIEWSNPLRMQMAGLAACLALLLLLSFNVVWRSFRRNAPVRRSAVYLVEESPAI